MANLKPVGIPKSIFLEGLFPKTFDATKLEEDKERVRNYYMTQGYFLARVTDSKVNMRNTGGGALRIPLFYPNKPGKKAESHADD